MTKKERFETFKRDGFVCQYCGRRPPDVLLQVDHIIPRKEGGQDDPDNLITSCQDCNLGKGATPLKSKIQPQIHPEQIERTEQLRGYYEAQADLEREIIRQVDYIASKIGAMWWDETQTLNQECKGSIRLFLSRGLHMAEIIDAGTIALRKSEYHRWRYFCGICWSKIKAKKDAES